MHVLTTRAPKTLQAGDLLDIVRDTLMTARLDDKERFKQMVLETKAGESWVLHQTPPAACVLRAQSMARSAQADGAGDQGR